jgi:anti-sigma B factor antagonist
MSAAENLPWTLQENADRSELKISGELDFTTSTKLRAALADFIKKSTGAIKLDLSELEYLDSSGLAVLIEMRKKLKAKDRDLTVTAIHPNAEKVFRLTQVAGLFGI